MWRDEWQGKRPQRRMSESLTSSHSTSSGAPEPDVVTSRTTCDALACSTDVAVANGQPWSPDRRRSLSNRAPATRP